MALRAGYYGLKKKFIDKVNKWDQLVFPRSEQAVLGAKNICSNIPTFTLLKSGDRMKNNTINEIPNIGTYKVSFTISDAANITKQGGIQLGDNAGNWSANPDGAFDVVNGRVVLTIPFDHAVSRVYVFLNGNDGDTATATFSDFMITLATDPDSNYVPSAMTNKELTVSAADQKTAINAIITAATSAADFAAFKAAMGAITPVTKSLSMAAAPEENIKDEIEEPVVEKKTTTRKKSTAKADTNEEV